VAAGLSQLDQRNHDMSDVAAYAVVKLQVTDNATYRQYGRGFFPLLTRHAATLNDRVQP
jgi:hypothetical protein